MLIFAKHTLNNCLLKLAFIGLLASTLFAYSGGTGGPNSPYQIASVSDWQQLMASSPDWDKNFILIADVNLKDVALTPVGYSVSFAGVFDGNGHTIRNATINSPDSNYIGLFGFLSDTGRIQNLVLEDVNITGNNDVGGLVGYNNVGTVSNCYAAGKVSGNLNVGGLVGGNLGALEGCSTAVSVLDNSYTAGGLASYNLGTITNCRAAGTVIGTYTAGGLVGINQGEGIITNSYADAKVSTVAYAGGMVSDNDGIIIDCYASGNVSAHDFVGGFVGNNENIMSNCYSIGPVAGDSHTGGLAAYNVGDISASFWNVNTSGLSASAGGTGKTTAQMKSLSTFTDAGWDFSEPVWKICDGTNYPKLAWQQPLVGDFVCPDGVDIYDLAAFSNHWLSNNAPYDINGDGIVNFLDFAIFAQNWLKGN